MQTIQLDEGSLPMKLVAKGELVLRAYETIRDTLRASNERAEVALENATNWRAATYEIETMIPVAYTQVLTSMRSVVNGQARLDEALASGSEEV